MAGDWRDAMRKFKMGDRVRFVCGGYNDRQNVGDEAVVIDLDHNGDAILDTDTPGEQIGWTSGTIEVVDTGRDELIAHREESSRFYAAQPPESPTLRDQFAMAALTGLLSDPETQKETEGDDPFAHFSNAAYEYAHAMMRARSEGVK